MKDNILGYASQNVFLKQELLYFSAAIEKSFCGSHVKHVNFVSFHMQLHVFPGYESDDLTPLPPPLSARDILETVTRAQLDLKKKVIMVTKSGTSCYTKLNVVT